MTRKNKKLENEIARLQTKLMEKQKRIRELEVELAKYKPKPKYPVPIYCPTCNLTGSCTEDELASIRCPRCNAKIEKVL